MTYTEFKVYTSKLHENDVICTFWLDKNSEVDTDNLPGKAEIAELLKTLIYKDVYVHETGKTSEDE